jgi:hypothetical protein
MVSDAGIRLLVFSALTTSNHRQPFLNLTIPLPIWFASTRPHCVLLLCTSIMVIVFPYRSTASPRLLRSSVTLSCPSAPLASRAAANDDWLPYSRSAPAVFPGSGVGGTRTVGSGRYPAVPFKSPYSPPFPGAPRRRLPRSLFASVFFRPQGFPCDRLSGIGPPKFLPHARVFPAWAASPPGDGMTDAWSARSVASSRCQGSRETRHKSRRVDLYFPSSNPPATPPFPQSYPLTLASLARSMFWLVFLTADPILAPPSIGASHVMSHWTHQQVKQNKARCLEMFLSFCFTTLPLRGPCCAFASPNHLPPLHPLAHLSHVDVSVAIF